jgi:ADP-ribose pyrophosphatase YjhB (NUDIX family)
MTERLPQQKDLARLYDGASIAVIKDRRVLLVRRARPPYARLWSLPGGKTEANETAQDAVRRELKEETGIEAEIEGVVDTFKIVPDEGGDSITYRLTVFYGRPTGGRLEAGGDAEAAEWVHLDNIEALPMTPGTADLIWVAAHRASMPDG